MKHINYFSNLCLLSILIAVVLTSGVNAQTPEKIDVKQNEGEHTTSLRKMTYYYPEFENGVVILANGASIPSKLNYNLLSGEIEFIDKNKDTLALNNLHTINSIIIATDSFYYDNDHKELLKLVANYKRTKLLVKDEYEVTNTRSIGALGRETDANVTQILPSKILKADPEQSRNRNLTFSIKSVYYFSENNRFLTASKSNALKLFPEHKAEINKYIKTNKTNFKKEKDLKKLLQYMAKL